MGMTEPVRKNPLCQKNQEKRNNENVISNDDNKPSLGEYDAND